MIAAMDKVKIEVVVAIILGLLAGIVITMGVTGRLKNINWAFLNKKTTNSISISPPTIINNNKPTGQKEFLEIIDLKESFTATSSFELSGSTSPNTEIVISSESEEKYLKTDSNGVINEIITLWPGKNLINITTLNFPKNISKELEIYYFPEK